MARGVTLGYDIFNMKKLYGEGWLLPVIIVGLFITPFLPLFVPGFLFFPYITGKAFAFRLIVEIIAVAWVTLAIQGSKFRPKRSLILLASSVFIFFVAMADFFGENPYRSLWSNLERMEGLVTHLHLFLYFLIIMSVFRTTEIWHRFFTAHVFGSVLVAGYGLLQLLGTFEIMQGGVRLDSTLGNAGYLGTYMFFAFFLTLYLLVTDWKNVTYRYFYLAIMALQTFILYQTATRGAILGFLAGLVITSVFLAWRSRHNKAIRNSAAAVLVLVVLIVGSVYTLRESDFIRQNPVLSRFASISLSDDTTKARFMVWNMAWQGIKERPLLGWGQDNFQSVFNKYYDPQMYAQEPWFDRSHNVFLDWAIAAGLFGLLAYLSLYFSSIYYLWRNSNNTFSPLEQSVWLGLLTGYLVQNLVIFDNLISYLVFLSILAYIHYRSSANQRNVLEGEMTAETKSYLVPVVGVVLVVVFSTVFYLAVAKPALASSRLIFSLNYMGRGQLVEAVNSFEQVFAYNTFVNREAVEQASFSLRNALYSGRTPSAELDKLASLVDENYQKTLVLFSGDTRSHLFYADFLEVVSRRSEAEKELLISLELSPRKQQILQKLAYFYANGKDFGKAIEYAKKAYDLAPESEESLKIYGLMALVSGQTRLAEDLLKPVYGGVAVDDDRYLNHFARINRYDVVVTILEKRLKSNPNNFDVHTKYAMALYAAGRRADALKALQTIKDNFPEQAGTIDPLITGVQTGRLQIN